MEHSFTTAGALVKIYPTSFLSRAMRRVMMLLYVRQRPTVRNAAQKWHTLSKDSLCSDNG